MSGAMIVQVISGVLAAAVLGIIVYRRKQKSA
jgi:LPXTG-motif cell wall-anchored protein